jgi:hypothetical protein
VAKQLERKRAESELDKRLDKADPEMLIQAYEWGKRFAAAKTVEAQQDVAGLLQEMLDAHNAADGAQALEMYEMGTRSQPAEPASENPRPQENTEVDCAGGEKKLEPTSLPTDVERVMELMAAQHIMTEACNGVRERAEVHGFASTKRFVDRACLSDVQVCWGGRTSVLHPLYEFMSEQAVKANRRPTVYDRDSAFDLLRFVSNASRHASIYCRRMTQLGAMQYILIREPVVFSIVYRLVRRLSEHNRCDEYGIRLDTVSTQLIEQLHDRLPPHHKIEYVRLDQFVDPYRISV